MKFADIQVGRCFSTSQTGSTWRKLDDTLASGFDKVGTSFEPMVLSTFAPYELVLPEDGVPVHECPGPEFVIKFPDPVHIDPLDVEL